MKNTLLRFSFLVWAIFSFHALLFAQTPPVGLTGSDLRNWFKSNYYDSKHTTLGYDNSRMYMYNYIDNENNVITGVYSGYQKTWTYGGTGTNPSPINCEHTVPQSYFDDAEPMRSDIHHLFPTYQNWNSTRSNYPFAEIDDSETTKWMRGTESQTSIPTSLIDEYSEYYSSTFEPREDHKGNCARAVFYFYTMYPTEAGSISKLADINTLYAWHLADPVDAEEMERNDEIETYQGNRNPYIDFPNLVDEAWEIITGNPPSAPQNVTLSVQENSMVLNWDDVTDETGTSIYRTISGGSYSLLSTLDADLTEYIDYDVSANTTYAYYLMVFNADGYSVSSDVVSGQLNSGDTGSGENTTELMISEYIEGSSYNKAIEIVNLSGSSVDLSNFSLARQVNGSGDWDSEYTLSGTLGNGDVFVVCHPSATPGILAVADVTYGGSALTFNGNDAVGLFKDGVLIDIVGELDNSDSWGTDITLVRKPSFVNGNTTFDWNEWTQSDANDYQDLGTHTTTQSVATLNDNSLAKIKAFPNPTSEWIDVQNTTPNAILELYNIEGKLVKTQSSPGNVRVDLSDVNKGVYILKIFSITQTNSIQIIRD